MDTTNYKILCFEYILYKLLEKHGQKCPNLDSKDILESYTRLKALKLLFLVSAAKASKKQEALLRIFDKFYAMERGPVESDIYDAMNTNNIGMYDFSRRKTRLNENFNIEVFQKIKESDCELINDSIDCLLSQNANILLEGPFSLVGITHKWSSWKIAYHIATALGKGSERMKIEHIKNDIKYFS